MKNIKLASVILVMAVGLLLLPGTSPLAAVAQSNNATNSLVIESRYTEVLQRFLNYLRGHISSVPEGEVKGIFTNLPTCSSNPGALLPQDQNYQRCLYDWLETLTISDVTIPKTLPTWDGTYRSTTELADTWMGVALNGVTSQVFPNEVLKGQAKWFVLDDGNNAGIEGSGKVRLASYSNNAAFWYQFDLPKADGSNGNPLYKHEGVCNRALASTAVDMMMSDYWHDQGYNPWGTGVLADDDPRFLGGLLNYWSYTYRVCKEILSENEQAAFEAGLERMTDKLLAQGPSRHTPNMQTRVLPAMANIYMSVDHPGFKDMTVRTAKKYMFGYENGVFETHHKFPQSLIYPAGYVQEGYSPETSYNGVSLYHLLEARAITKNESTWSFMDEPIRRMLDFRAHQIFPDRDNLVIGPSAYAGRTGHGWDKLQASHPWRDISSGGFFEEGRPFTKIESTASMVTQIKNFVKNNRLKNHFNEINTDIVPEFAIDHDHHWPGYMPYAPRTGWYDSLSALWNSDSESFTLPYERTNHEFNKSFDNDFWAYKSNSATSDFGFFVESEADGGTYGGYRGGSLQAFWSKDGGVYILGRQNKSSDERKWNQIDKWGTNHVWGRTSSGYFSSAVEQKRNVKYALGGANPMVTVSGVLSGSAQQAPISINLITTFRALANGIRIEHIPGSLPPSMVQEAWATIPVFLRDCNPSNNKGSQCDLEETTIEYWNGSQWKNLTSTLVSAQDLRLGRDAGNGTKYVYIVLSEPRKVKLSASVWQQTYQSNSRLRNIHISLMPNITSAGSISFSYSILNQEMTPRLMEAGFIPSTETPLKSNRKKR